MKIIEKYTTTLAALNLAESTRCVYLSEFKKYCHYFDGHDIRYISRESIIKYLADLFLQGYSSSKVNQAINAIKFFKEKVNGEKRQTYFIKRPKREQFIPTILTPEKIRAIIFNTRNLKHRAILFTIYDNGLRISELLNLTLMDLRTKCENPHLVIRRTKGKKSRIINISGECVQLLREYYLQYKPKTYLFEGEKPHTKYSKTSIRNILNTACQRENIKFRLRVHDLRHNFATHCLARETDIHHMANFLGHSSVKTTEKTYSHLLFNQIKIHRSAI